MKKSLQTMKNIIVVVALVFGCFCGIATREVAAATTEDGFGYELLDDGTIMVTDYTGTKTELVIPGEIDGKEVTSIGGWAFYDCLGLTSLELPKSVVSIGDYAFFRCVGLTNIVIPNSVVNIGEHAFEECSGLTGLDIPKGVETIGNSAFKNCRGLTSLKIPEGVTSINDSVFYGCFGLTNFIIPESVTSIGASAFYYCGNLVSISIPQGVESIGASAFYGCSSLSNLEIPVGVTSIGDLAFGYCSGISSIVIPNSVTSIGDSAFYFCSDLISLVIPNSVTTIGNDLFLWCPKDMVVYGDVNSVVGSYAMGSGFTVKPIGNKYIAYALGTVVTAYAYDWSYKTPIGTDMSIQWRNNVLTENVDYQIVAYKDNLYVGIGSVILEGIGDYYGRLAIRFEIAKAEKPANAPEDYINVDYSTKTVGACMLPAMWTWNEADKTKELQVGIPVQVTAYYSSGDKDYFRQTSVDVTIVRSACEHVWDVGVVVKPATTKNDGEIVYTCQKCNETRTQTIDKLPIPKRGDVRQDKDGNANYVVTKSSASKVEVAFVGVVKNAKTVTIPCEVILSDGTKAKVTSIAKNALKNNNKVTKVQIGNNVKTIGNDAFSGCTKLKTVVMGKNITTIGARAFKNCKSMASVTLGTKVTTIDKEAFRDCSKLKTITIKSKKLKKVGKNAFKGIKSNAKIKVPASKLKSYKKLLKGKGQGKKVKITK